VRLGLAVSKNGIPRGKTEPKTDMNGFRKTPVGGPVEVETDRSEYFARVESQVRRATLGGITSLDCPYCSSNVTLGVEKLCCTKMGEAVETVLTRMEAEDISETVASPIADHCQIDRGCRARNSIQ
jgi:hypothetical protein